MADIEKVDDKIKNVLNSIKKRIPDFIKDRLPFILAITFLFFIVIYGFSYIYYILSGKLTKQCKRINSIYLNNIKIKSVENSDTVSSYPIAYYYIKSSYNSCSVGNYVDDYVGLCILDKIISQGVRFFDFEIFNINNQAVVSTSTTNDTRMKETYNFIPFSAVLSRLVDQGLKNVNKSCPNEKDPLFINLRMKTNTIQVYDNIASLLKNYTNQYLLEDKYNCKNMLEFGKKVLLSDLLGKIVLFVNSPGTILESSHLYEYTNISTYGNPYFQTIPFKDAVNDDKESETNFTKENFILVYPDVYNGAPTNPDPTFCFSCGIQFIGMSYQVFDSYLQAYEYWFDKYQSAFILKNKALLPTTINATFSEVPVETPKTTLGIEVNGTIMNWGSGGTLSEEPSGNLTSGNPYSEE
jgi:hypothetical protein